MYVFGSFDAGSQKVEVQKNCGGPSSSAISSPFVFPSTFSPHHYLQQFGYQLHLNCSGGTILSQIVFPICITTQLVPKQAELFRIQRFGADVSYHLVGFKVMRNHFHVLNLIPDA